MTTGGQDERREKDDRKKGVDSGCQERDRVIGWAWNGRIDLEWQEIEEWQGAGAVNINNYSGLIF